MKRLIIFLMIGTLLNCGKRKKQAPPKAEYQVLTISGDTLNLIRSPLDGNLYMIK